MKPEGALKDELRIVFFSPDYGLKGDHPAWGGAPYYRCILPARELAKHGHETYVSPTVIVHEETGFLTGQTATGEIADPDVFVIHSWAENGAEAILRAREAGQIVIGDIDDLIWEVPEGHMAESLDGTNGKSLDNIWKNFMCCSALTVSTPYIKEWMESALREIKLWHGGANPPVYVIRNAIDLENFQRNSMRDKVRVIGWSGNPLWRADDLSLLRPWLNDFCLRHKLKFLHVGALPHQSIASQLDIDPKLLIQRPFRTFEDFRKSNPLREMDIQLIPLLDCPFNRAKSALKGMESAAWGIPFVQLGLPSEEYREMTHFTLTQIAGKGHKLRRQHQQSQYEWVQTFNITSRWVDWDSCYRELAASRYTPHRS